MQLSKLIAPIAVIISMVLFYSTSNYGLVTDYMGWLNKYRDGGWTDVLHCFNYPGLHQFFHLINYAIFKITNADMFQLYLIFAITHGMVSYGVYRSLRKYAEWIKWGDGSLVAFFTAIVFLVSPYQIETVTWKACYHYMMVTGLTSLSIIQMIKYFKGERKSHLVLHLVLFALSLFTLEISLIIPGIFAMLFISKSYIDDDYNLYFNGVNLTAIHAWLYILYFIITKLVIGDFIGHYGAEKHMVFTPSLLITTASKYFVKYFSFSHYLPFQSRYDLYASLSELRYGIAILIPVLVLLFFSVFKFKEKKSGLVISLGLICFFISLLPVLNLYFMNLHTYENDRYGYFASQFFYLGMISFLFLFKRFKYTLCLIYIGVNLFFANKTIRDVNVAGKVITNLVENFKWYDEPEIVITGLPENMNGAYMFRDFSEAGVALKESLEWQGRKVYSGDMKILSNYNMKNDQPHLTAKLIAEDTLEVWDIMPGSWFWRKGVGMYSYHKNGVKAVMKEGHFIATFDDPKPNVIYLTPEGDKWEVVKVEYK
jgi:hypothetical protein